MATLKVLDQFESRHKQFNESNIMKIYFSHRIEYANQMHLACVSHPFVLDVRAPPLLPPKNEKTERNEEIVLCLDVKDLRKIVENTNILEFWNS